MSSSSDDITCHYRFGVGSRHRCPRAGAENNYLKVILSSSWGLFGMPRISEFFGISIYLYFDDRSHHSLPHIHAKYGGNEAVYSIQTSARLAGGLPRRQNRLVKEWISLRTNELEHAWECAVKMEDPGQIEPLT